MKATSIPSPLPYLASLPDERDTNSTYEWETLLVFMLLAIGSGSKNILAIAQWLEDQKAWLMRQGLTTRTGRIEVLNPTNSTPRVSHRDLAPRKAVPQASDGVSVFLAD